MSASTPQDDNEFDLARLLAAAELEQTVNPTETHEARAKRILEEAATVAAMSLVQLSRQAVNERLRFSASTYILDRVLGDAKGSSGTTPVWQRVFEGITVPDDVSSIDKK